MVSKEILTVLCGLGLSMSVAVAEPAPPPPPGAMGHGAPVKQMSKADMQKMHARMCLAGYAHEVGRLAQLKVQLQLTGSQESAFKAWKSVKLGAASARKADCMAMKLPPMMGPKAGKPGVMPGAMGPKPDMLKGLQMEEKHLNARLKEIKAEMPALKKLLAVLSDDQKAAFMPPMGGPKGGPGPKPGPDHGGPHGGPHDGSHGPMGGPDKA